MSKISINQLKDEAENYLKQELLPFWLNRCMDIKKGGFITHFDQEGKDTGEDQKSLIAQTRTIFSMSRAHRAGYGVGKCARYAAHGVHHLLNKMWDDRFGGFYWIIDRKGILLNDQKITYGLSFAIYSLSEYTLATGDMRGLEYAEKTFDLLQRYAVDTMYGGYYEMFTRKWDICGPGGAGGDRKTLDVHMHLMEAFTNLYECSTQSCHKQRLIEIIEILLQRILHPQYATGIPQFWRDWRVAPQIKFDVVWGLDRFAESGSKLNAEDNTSYGHNAEFAWLLNHALDVTGMDKTPYLEIIRKQLDHTLEYGIDYEYGGVYVEGLHSGKVTDMEKEFWQQAEVMIAMLDGCLLFGPDKYWPAYENVHRFVFDHVINHKVGEWWPLMTRAGQPIWTHMSNSWKVSYHTIRCMVECVRRLNKLANQFK